MTTRKTSDGQTGPLAAAARRSRDRAGIASPEWLGGPARKQIECSGGLVSIGGLAARWGITKQAAGQHVRKPGFPEPIQVEGATYFKVWLADECEVWRATRTP